MTLTAPSKNVAAFDKGRLAAGISATATTITISPIFKTVNGVRVKQGFDSTSGECLISQGDYIERISFEGKSVDSTTKITTLTSCTRGLPTTNITADFSSGTGKIWSKGAAIVVIDSASYNQSSVFTNTDNAFTGANTFAGTSTFNAPVIVAGATSYVKLPELTTTQRDALTAAEGMLIKNSTTGTNQQYVGGAWSDVGDTGTPNSSTTVAGKVEEATAAEIAASTAAGATGARLFINPSSVVKTSSGAADENKLPVLGSDGKLAAGFLPALISTYTVSNKTANYTMTTNDLNYVMSNIGATIGVTLTLPSASAGQYYHFIPYGGYSLNIVPSSGDNIVMNGITTSVLYNYRAYDYIDLIALDTTTWVVNSVNNNWGYTNRGYFCGGYQAGHKNAIDYLNMTDETSVALSITIASASEDLQGVSTQIIGYLMGGTTDLGATGLNTIQKLTMYGTETISTISATLDTARSSGASGMSNVKGYVIGGVNSTLRTTISALVFATEAEANIGATMATATWRMGSCQSSTKAYALSGSTSTGGGSTVATIKALTFGTEAIANLASSFSAAESSPAGVCSSLAGYQMGGDSATTTIRKLLYSDESVSNLAATLDSGHNAKGGGVSGATAGYIAGGSASTVIENLVFASETSVAIAATLDTARDYIGTTYPNMV